MNKTKTEQKKKTLFNFLYAMLIGLLVVGCATAIAMISTSQNKPVADIGQAIQVSTNTYVVPMKNATLQKDYSAQELQFNDTLKQWEIHRAIDLLATDDLNVFAISNGTVSNVYNNYLEGGVVEITHTNGLVSIYKSLTDITVKVGDKVTAGQTIGKASTTMASELNHGAHLHLELTLNGKKVDPKDYLSLGSK